MRIAIIRHKGEVSPVYELAQTISVHEVDVKSGVGTDLGVHPFVLDTSFAFLAAEQVKAVLVGTIDPDNAEILSRSGIHVFMGADDIPPAENVDRFVALMRRSIERGAEMRARKEGGAG